MLAFLVFGAMRSDAATGQALANDALRALAARGVPDRKISRVTVDITLDGPRTEIKLRCGTDGAILGRGAPREPSELVLTLDVRERCRAFDAFFAIDLVSDGRVTRGGPVKRPGAPEPAGDAATAVLRAIDALGVDGPGLAGGRLALERLEDVALVREVKLRELARGTTVRAPRDERAVDAGTLLWQVRVDPALRPLPPPNPWEIATARQLANLDEQLVHWALSRPITPPTTRRPRPEAARPDKKPVPRYYNAFIENAHVAAVKRAVAALKANDPAAAESCLRTALQATPESVTALKGLAAALLAQSRYADVVALVTPARSKRRADLGLALLLARAHTGLRQPAPALKLLEEVRARDPRAADLPFHFGVAYFHADRFAEALPALTASTIVSPLLREQAKKFAESARQLAD